MPRNSYKDLLLSKTQQLDNFSSYSKVLFLLQGLQVYQSSMSETQKLQGGLQIDLGHKVVLAMYL